jgi:hypothetical protein
MTFPQEIKIVGGVFSMLSALPNERKKERTEILYSWNRGDLLKRGKATAFHKDFLHEEQVGRTYEYENIMTLSQTRHFNLETLRFQVAEVLGVGLFISCNILQFYYKKIL